MSSIPDPPRGDQETAPDPWYALALCDRLRELLEAHYRAGAVGYSAQRDLTYRRTRGELVDLLHRAPAFRTLRKEAHVYPATLASHSGEIFNASWDVAGRDDVVRFQGKVLTALETAGVPYPAAPAALSPDPTELGKDGSGAPQSTGLGSSGDARGGTDGRPGSADAARPTWASARRASNRQRARTLRARGETVGEIARKLDVSERTVYNYLNDLPEGR